MLTEQQDRRIHEDICALSAEARRAALTSLPHEAEAVAQAAAALSRVLVNVGR